MTRKTLLALPLIMLAPFATAQESTMDTDGDGMVSFPELQAAMPEMTDVDFGLLDTSGDGMLDADEIAAGQEAGLLVAEEG